MSEPLLLPKVFVKIADLGLALGVRDLNRLPGPWFHRVDEHWAIAVNGKRETVHIPETAERMAVDLPPFSVVAWYDGWLAGVFNAAGGWFAAGSLANESALIAALEKAEEEACRGRGDYCQ